jgi:uncharacterized membrane protein
MLLAPAASAYVTDSTHSPPVTDEPTATSPLGDSPAASNPGNETNYTRLYIDDGYRHGEIKPGESTTFNVTVGNSEDQTVELDPHVVLPKLQGRPIEKSWVTIEQADTSLEPDEERTFTVTVTVPEETDLGDYNAQIAFTNQTVAYPGETERPVHAAHINVGVYKEPTVTIRGDRYNYAQVKAGETYTYEYVVENTGDEAIPLDPTFNARNRGGYRYGDDTSVERSWFTVDAPNEVQPGENATVRITVAPPESADLGSYNAEFDLGLKDPARPDRSGYWQQVRLRFQVWQQPEEPFEKEFHVESGTESVELTLTAGERSQSDMPVSFDVAFVAPNGTVVEHRRVRSTSSGAVNLGESSPTSEEQGAYASNGEIKSFEYRVDDPPAGNWTVEIMPRNTMHFQYEIVRNETA